MAEMAVADGIGTIVATPHQLGSHAKNSGDTIRAATVRFQQFLDGRRLPLRVLPGADVRIEPDLLPRIRRGEVLTLADRRRHVLLELPHDVYVPLERLLAELASAGLVGILSHPERNLGILNQPGVLRPLVERGCLLQVTAGSLTGAFGSADSEVHRVAGRTRARPFRQHRRAWDEDSSARAAAGVRAGGGTGRRGRGRGPLLSASGGRGHRRHGAGRTPKTGKVRLGRMVSLDLFFRTCRNRADIMNMFSWTLLGVCNIS